MLTCSSSFAAKNLEIKVLNFMCDNVRVMREFSNFSSFQHNNGKFLHHIETIKFLYSANQWTGFYKMGTFKQTVKKLAILSQRNTYSCQDYT